MRPKNSKVARCVKWYHNEKQEILAIKAGFEEGVVDRGKNYEKTNEVLKTRK